MDVFEEELLAFWRTPDNNKVKYIMTGDVAAYLHGCEHLTEVTHIWIKDTLENRKTFTHSF